MTIKELKSGVKFSYDHGNYYSMECTEGGRWIICQFGRYIASVESIGNRYIKAFTYVVNKKVTLKVDISKCIAMEEPAGAVIL